MVDWIDPDINVRLPYGAEDDYYSSLDRSYRTANQPMASVSELRLVKGINETIYQRILPYVTVLPSTSGATTPIDVNTAPPQVLATLTDGMDVDQGMALVKLRQGNPFKDVTAFMDALKVVAPDVTLSSDVAASTSTTYFDVQVETEIGYGRAALTSLLLRTEQDIQVVRRAQGLN
jgi:general secretion pathway protein K